MKKILLFIALFCGIGLLKINADEADASLPAGYFRTEVPANSQKSISLRLIPFDADASKIFLNLLTPEATDAALYAGKKWDGIYLQQSSRPEKPQNSF